MLWITLSELLTHPSVILLRSDKPFRPFYEEGLITITTAPERKLGCCALCNFNAWVLPNEKHKLVCEDTTTCELQQIRNYEVAVKANFITSMLSLCDTHLQQAWGLKHTKESDKDECPTCANNAMEDESSL